MPTRSERARTAQERARQNEKPKRKPTTKARRQQPAADAEIGTGNRKRAAPRATAALESSATARPSRKSTRKSANRQKPDGPLELRQTVRAVESRRRPRPR